MSSGSSAILAVRILGDAKGAVSAMKESEEATGGLVGKIKGMLPNVAAIGTAFVGAGIAAGKALYDIGSQFDDMSDTIRVGTGASGEALDSLVDSAKTIATQIPASLEDIGTTVADVNTRLGLSGEVLQTVSSQYLEAGRILGEQVDISTTTGAFSAFKVEGETVVEAMDDLFRVSQATGVSMNTLAGSAQKNAGSLQEMGFTFTESIALIGGLDKAGIDADATLSAMRRGLVSMAKPGQSMGDAFYEVTGKINDFIAAGDTAAATDLAAQVFGTRGATQMIQALETGLINTEDLTGAIATTGDTILGVGQETMDASEKFEILKNRAMVALEPLASELFDGLGAAMDWVLGITEDFDFNEFLDAHPVISDLITATQEFATALSSVLGPIIEALAPIVFDTLSVIGTYFTDLLNLFSEVFTFIGQLISGDWAGAWNTMGQIVAKGGELITNLVTGIGNVVASTIASAITWARDTWEQGWASISGTVSTKISQIKSNVINGFTSLPSQLFNVGQDLGRGLINGIGSMGHAIKDAASNLARGAIDSIKATLGIHSPSRVGMKLGAFFGQGIALGLRGSAPRVDQAATDLVSPLARDIMPNSPRSGHRTPASHAQQPIVINVSGALDPIGVAEQIRNLLDMHQRRTSGVVL